MGFIYAHDISKIEKVGMVKEPLSFGLEIYLSHCNFR